MVELYTEFANLNLADPTSDTKNKIDMLLGVDVYGQVLLDGMTKGPLGTPQRNALGWILSGSIKKNSYPSRNISVNHAHDFDIHMIKQFWELENVSTVVDPKEVKM